MKMKNTLLKPALPLIIFSLAVSPIVSTRAQDAGTATSAPSSATSAPASATNSQSTADASNLDSSKEAKSARKLADEWIANKGWVRGWNKDGSYVEVGRASFSGKSQNTALAKSNAFQFATLMAKNALAKLLSAKISSAVVASLKEGTIPSDDKGVPSDVVALLAEKVKNSGQSTDQVINSKNFASAVQVAARAEVCGATVSNAFQTVNSNGDGAFAVVVRMTPGSRQLVLAALGRGEAPHSDVLADAQSWVKQASEQDLAGTFGVRLFKTGNGEICMVAFGQADVNGKSENAFDIAAEKADTAALGELRQFVGEWVEGDKMRTTQSSFQEMSQSGSQYADAEAFNQLIQARAQGLNLPGVQTIRQWEAKPDEGKPISGSVIMWSVSGSDKANALRKQMEAIGGSKGGEGRMNSTPTSSSSAPASADRNIKRINPGAAGPETPEL